MGGLVEDLLMLARLDDQRPLRFAPVDLTVLAADAAQDARAIDPTRRSRCPGARGPLGPTLVPGDDAKLRQVLANLVSNALNHTPDGSPLEIAVGTRESDQHVVLEVRDHGPGVDPEKARKVFERFYRADPSRVRGTGGGNGLGLAIAAAIVNCHQGRIGVAQTDWWRGHVRRGAAHRQLSDNAQHPLTLAGLTEVIQPHQGVRTP